MNSFPSLVLAFLVIVLQVLDSAVICNGGKTSTYVRKVEKAVDMPLDSDVFRVPPGYNAPQQVAPRFLGLVFYIFLLSMSDPRQTGSKALLVCWLCLRGFRIWHCFCKFKVHITQGDHVGKAVIVSWVTEDEPGSSTVVYWSENSKEKKQAKGKFNTYRFFNYTSGFIHHCTIGNLEVNLGLFTVFIISLLLFYLMPVWLWSIQYSV